MKILHVINTLHIGGAERLLVDIAPLMLQEGHEVKVLVLNPQKTELMQELMESGVSVKVIKGFYNEYNPLLAFRLIPYLKGFDIVHAHLFPSQYWVALASLGICNPPVLVTTEHSTGNSRVKYKITSWIDKKIYECYDGIFCISQGTKDFMKTRVADSEKLYVVTNGIKIARFESARASREKLFPDIPKEDKILMQVARFGVQKNQACVIRAMKLLPAGYHLCFVGTGIHENICKDLAKKLDLMQKITFLGERSDIPELLSVADIVIMSSHWEGFGLSAAEAMAAGKLVLASDVPGLSQVVADPDLRFEEDNEYALKDLILKYTDSDLCSRKVLWARDWVRQYDVRNTSHQYINMYGYLLEKKYGKEK